MTTYWLSMHLPYACRHSGACCTSGWPIPVEQTRVAPLRVLRPDGRWLLPSENAPAEIGGLLATDARGHCLFFDARKRERSDGHCEIHRALGQEALPSACQHFPRECLIDGRGVFVTLSHYCPTAASLLFDDAVSVAIVEGPAVLPSGEPEGLDAREALPPLLRPGMLMDRVSYSLWEAHMVRRLTGTDHLPESVLDSLEAEAHALSDWQPSDGTLADAVGSLSASIEASLDPPLDWPRERALFAVAVKSLAPEGWPDYPDEVARLWREKVAVGWRHHRRIINRFVAAHAFASWWAYQGSGVQSQIVRLRLALAVLRAESIRSCADHGAALNTDLLKSAIRQTDLLIVHLIDRGRLAEYLQTP